MSNINGDIASFNKAIISLWFRVPAQVLDGLSPGQDLAHGGVAPIFTFGTTSRTFFPFTIGVGIDSATWTVTSYNTPGGHCDWTASHIEPHTSNAGFAIIEGEDTGDIGPSYLGVTSDRRLVLSLLTDSPGSGTGIGQNGAFRISSYGVGGPTGEILDCNVETHWDFSTRSFREGSVAPGNPQQVGIVTSDDGGVTLRSGGNDSFSALEGIEIQPDTWHHLLLSFDVSSASHAKSGTGNSTSGDYGDSSSSTEGSFSNPCKIWAALDDVNITGGELRQDLTGLGPNEFLSRNTIHVFGSSIGGSFRSAGWGVSGSWSDDLFSSEQAIFSASGAPLPASPFGIPVASNFQGKMKHIEMAEFQMWTGQTLNTGNTTSRRLFIAPKKKSGGGEALKPVNPKKAKDALGDPVLLFHRVANWKKGKNTGSGSDFNPSGKIEKYKPDPEIGK